MNVDAGTVPPPCFSVIIPAFNAAPTIEGALDSCLLQSYPPLEILVVDDKSTDDTAVLVEKMAHPLIRLIRLPQNAGPSAARNAGMDAARGAYFAFLDADDTWHPDKLKIVAAGIRAHPDAALWFHDVTTRPLAPVKAGPAAWQYFPFKRLLLRNVITPSCATIKAGPLRFYEPMRYCEDYDLWLRISAAGNMYYLAAPLAKRARPMLAAGGQSSSKWDMRKGELKAYARIAWRQKWLLPLLPLLWAYSLMKHAAKPFR